MVQESDQYVQGGKSHANSSGQIMNAVSTHETRSPETSLPVKISCHGETAVREQQFEVCTFAARW